MFVAPLSRQDEFYVEETRDDDRGDSTVEGTTCTSVTVLTVTPILIHPYSSGSDSEGTARASPAADDLDFVKPETNGTLDETEDSSGSSFEELQH